MKSQAPAPAPSIPFFIASLAGIALVFLSGVYLAFARPMGRGPDEFLHLAYIHHLINVGQLPIATLPPELNVASQESVQPPLYYTLSAIAIAPLSHILEPLSPVVFNTLTFMASRGLALENSPIFYAPPRLWPQATLVSGYLLRLLSTILGLAGFLALYLLAKSITGNQWVGLASALWLALTPTFMELASSVTNDALLIPLSAFALFFIFNPIKRTSIILGLLLGLLALTKVNGLLLVFPALWSVAASPKDRTRSTATLAGIVALIAGWWYLRNLLLYGEPTGISAMLAIEGAKGALTPQPLGRSMWEAIFIFLQSFVSAPSPYLVLGLVGLLGLILALRNPEKSRVILLLGFTFLLGIVAFLFWAGGLPHGRHARLLLPVLPGLSALWALGMASLVPKRFYALVPGLVVLVGLPGLVDGFRAPPLHENAHQFMPVLSPYDRPSIEDQTSVSFAQNLFLQGYTVEVRRENVYVSLRWSMQESPGGDVSLFVHLDREGGDRTLSQSDTFSPYDTPHLNSWRRGVEMVNVHRLRLPQRRPLWIQVGAYYRDTLERLAAVDQNGKRLLHDLVLIEILR